MEIPQWRNKPTCDGTWCCKPGSGYWQVWWIDAEIRLNPEDPLPHLGKWYGPIPDETLSLPSISSEQVEWMPTDYTCTVEGIEILLEDHGGYNFSLWRGSRHLESATEPYGSLEEAKSAAISAVKGLKEEGNV